MNLMFVFYVNRSEIPNGCLIEDKHTRHCLNTCQLYHFFRNYPCRIG